MTRISMLFSAGKESVLSLHLLRKQYRKAEIDLLHFNYGQAAYNREWEAGRYYANLYKATYNVLPLKIDIPDGIATGFGENHVKGRNLIFISMAVNWSLSRGIDTILVPFTKADKNEYTDSSLQYLDAVALSYLHLYPKLVLFSNLTNHSRTSHYELMKNKVDVSYVWSCDSKGRYTDGTRPIHCGKCAKCVDFIKNCPQTQGYLQKVNYYQHEYRKNT